MKHIFIIIFSTGPNHKEINIKNQKVHNLYTLDYPTIATYDVGLKPHSKFPLQRKTPAIKPLLSKAIDTIEAYTKLHNLPNQNYAIELKRIPLYDDINHPDGATFVRLVLAVFQNRDIMG